MYSIYHKFNILLVCCLPILHITTLLANDKVTISGELKQWHKVTLTLDGPRLKETSKKPNPFTELQLDVKFTHESGSPSYLIPGYFAADGKAAETSATEGNKWRAHLSPDKTGLWNYSVSFSDPRLNGLKGSFRINLSDKKAPDLRAKGRLEYVGKRYLQFAGTGQYFLKAGADSPETFLAYSDFDGTTATKPKKSPLKTWAPHIKDWSKGDPFWKVNKGKGIIGAINYLANAGGNVFSFIPYNAGGDGDNVWPHISRSEKLHFDCSKLDQWGIVFDHAATKGMYLHFKLQETENDDLKGPGKDQALDKGKLGPERKAYLRQMVARYGYHLALNWNIGEENTQSIDQIIAQAKYIRKIDPYGHLVVIHTYTNQQEKIYGKLVGKKEILTGVSIQNSNVANSHRDALKWVIRSEKSGHPWVVAFDEAGNAYSGSPPDPSWPKMAAIIKKNKGKNILTIPSVDDVRSEVLWGTLMAGGAGVEYYFGYNLPENDLLAENWRSRALTWKYSRIAIDFFHSSKIPFWEMKNHNNLLKNTEGINDAYCFAKPNNTYLVYNRKGKDLVLDLSATQKKYHIHWFNPRTGEPLKQGSLKTIAGGKKVNLGAPPASQEKNIDWAILLRAHNK